MNELKPTGIFLILRKKLAYFTSFNVVKMENLTKTIINTVPLRVSDNFGAPSPSKLLESANGL